MSNQPLFLTRRRRGRIPGWETRMLLRFVDQNEPQNPQALSLDRR